MNEPTRPPIPPRSECRDCANPIVFGRNDHTGKLIPLDPMPSGRGNVAMMKIGNQLHGYVVSHDHPFDPRYIRMMPHAATCPDRKGPAKSKSSPESDPALF